MNQIIQTLKSEAENLKNSESLKEDFPFFLLKLKSKINESRLNKHSPEIHNELLTLESFKSFDKLPWITRVLHHVMISKMRPDYYDDWKNKGQYLYDIDIIITKLDAILFRLTSIEI